MKHFIVPRVAPVFCAFGMMYADLKHNYTRPFSSLTGEADLERMDALFAEMEKDARATLAREGVPAEEMIIEQSMDLHYYGQVREQTVPVWGGPVTPQSLATTVELFHEKHRRVIGYSEPGYPVLVVRLHLAGTARIVPPPPRAVASGSGDLSAAWKGTRRAFFPELGGSVEVDVYEGERFGAGDLITGPCIIEERMTTLVLPPREIVRVDADGSYTTIMEG